MKKLMLLFSVLCLFLGCKVEFSPNGSWQEIPAVYCVLDQDDDTSYVRVQKCYLGNNNVYEDATIFDSINYPQDALTVLLEEWSATIDGDSMLHATGNVPRKIYTFDYKMATDKDSGMFVSPHQPIYVCETRGQLDSTCLYKLLIRKNENGDTLAYATTQLLWGNMALIEPNDNHAFDFTGNQGNRFCRMEFSALQGGRRYQPMIRFYYRNFWLTDNPDGTRDTNIRNHSIDIETEPKKSNLREDIIEYIYPQGSFLNAVYMAVKHDTLPKNVRDTVDIYVRVCDEALSQYLYTHTLHNGINQMEYRYSNIINGNPALPAMGVFASRRTHILFTVRTPRSDNSGYKKGLDSLYVGFGGHWKDR